MQRWWRSIEVLEWSHIDEYGKYILPGDKVTIDKTVLRTVLSYATDTETGTKGGIRQSDRK